MITRSCGPGLRLLLEREQAIEPVAEAADAAQAVERAAEQQPDLVLLDVSLPGRNAITLIPELLAACPTAHILVLSMHDEPAYVRDALAAGASGYLLKDAADTELVAAIRTVADHGTYLTAALTAAWSPGRQNSRQMLTPTRSQRASTKSPASSRSDTQTRRSPPSCRSLCAQSRPTANTSCTSSGSARAPNSSATPSHTTSYPATPPDATEGGVQYEGMRAMDAPSRRLNARRLREARTQR